MVRSMFFIIPIALMTGVYARNRSDKIIENCMKLSRISDDDLWKHDIDGNVYKALMKEKECEN